MLFDRIIPDLDMAGHRQAWCRLEVAKRRLYMLNNLNRALGLPDGYPFVLSPPVIEKVRFVHDTVGTAVASRP